MPTIETFTVGFPDGESIQVQGPSTLSDSQVFDLALQERGMKEGRIQTSWLGGASKQMGQEKVANTAIGAATGAAVGGPVGMVIGAASPLASTWLDYATKKFTGENPELPSKTTQAVDVVSGAASVVPVGTVAKTIASAVTPKILKPLLKASSLSNMGPMLEWARKRVTAAAPAAAMASTEGAVPEAAEQAGSYLWKMSGQAMVDASNAERMILQRQRQMLNEIAKSQAAKEAAEKAAAEVLAKAKVATPSKTIQALQAGIRAAYKVAATTLGSALTQEAP